MNLEIFDNFLLPEDFTNLHNTIFNEEFPWSYTPAKNSYETDLENKTIFQFTHLFYNNFMFRSQYSEILRPIIRELGVMALIRIKANLTTITPERINYGLHRDYGVVIPKSKTACFYVNTNDGLTIFSTGQEVKSVANRLVVFDSDSYHAGTSCTDEKVRVVINFNYF